MAKYEKTAPGVKANRFTKGDRWDKSVQVAIENSQYKKFLVEKTETGYAITPVDEVTQPVVATPPPKQEKRNGRQGTKRKVSKRSYRLKPKG